MRGSFLRIFVRVSTSRTSRKIGSLTNRVIASCSSKSKAFAAALFSFAKACRNTLPSNTRTAIGPHLVRVSLFFFPQCLAFFFDERVEFILGHSALNEVLTNGSEDLSERPRG